MGADATRAARPAEAILLAIGAPCFPSAALADTTRPLPLASLLGPPLDLATTELARLASTPPPSALLALTTLFIADIL